MAKHITMIRNCAVEQNLDGVRRLKIWEGVGISQANLWFFELWWYKGLSPFAFPGSLHMTYKKGLLFARGLSFAKFIFFPVLVGHQETKCNRDNVGKMSDQ